MNDSETRISELSFRFAVSAVKLHRHMINDREYVISRQFLRSATSIAANIREASAGYSRKDWLAKMAIASKEARETEYWLQLMQETGIVTIDISSYLEEIAIIVRVLTKILKTAQEKNT